MKLTSKVMEGYFTSLSCLQSTFPIMYTLYIHIICLNLILLKLSKNANIEGHFNVYNKLFFSILKFKVIKGHFGSHFIDNFFLCFVHRINFNMITFYRLEHILYSFLGIKEIHFFRNDIN